MISVSREAGLLLTSLLQQARLGAEDGQAFRLIRDRRRDVGMLVPGRMHECDVPVVYDDQTLLLLTAPVAAELDGSMLDVTRTKSGRARLVWRAVASAQSSATGRTEVLHTTRSASHAYN